MQIVDGTGGLVRTGIAAALAFAIACSAGTYAYLDARLPADGPEQRAGARPPHAEPAGHRGPAISATR